MSVIKFKGIMFHHLHDNKKFQKSDGSITGKSLEKLINKIGKDNILNPNNLKNSDFLNDKKNNNKFFLTFDDGLKCQITIASKILKKHNIKAFFFIFSSILTKDVDLLEVYRDFRYTKYNNIDLFYEDFFNEIYNKFKIRTKFFFKENKLEIIRFKKVSPYYSLNDIKFRLVRNTLINEKKYKELMFYLFKKKKYNYKSQIKRLYMNKNDLKKIINEGHVVGLHSHNHSVKLDELSLRNQIKEFKINKNLLENITKQRIFSASYPFGNFNINTIKALNKIGIEIAFKKNDTNNEFKRNLNLQIQRVNHTTLIKKYKIR